MVANKNTVSGFTVNSSGIGTKFRIPRRDGMVGEVKQNCVEEKGKSRGGGEETSLSSTPALATQRGDELSVAVGSLSSHPHFYPTRKAPGTVSTEGLVYKRSSELRTVATPFMAHTSTSLDFAGDDACCADKHSLMCSRATVCSGLDEEKGHPVLPISPCAVSATTTTVTHPPTSLRPHDASRKKSLANFERASGCEMEKTFRHSPRALCGITGNGGTRRTAFSFSRSVLLRTAVLMKVMIMSLVAFEELRVPRPLDVGQGNWRGFGCLSAMASSEEAHKAIGRTAMSALKARALAQTKRLLNGKDLVDVAWWGHRVTAKYKFTTALHFQLQPKGECETVKEDYQCPDGFCLLKGIEYFYHRLTNEGEPVELNFSSGIRLTDADALKYLITLLADMHEPFRFGRVEDDCGRKHLGTLPQGPYGEQKKSSSLFDIWDHELVERLANYRPVFWNSGWTHVNNVKAFFEREKKLFAENKGKQFKAWANESLQLLCGSIRMEGTNNQLSNPFTLTPGTEETWVNTLKTQILIAGARTAIVLNSILEAREASALRQGSGVQDVGAEGDESANTGLPAWLRNLLTNLLIIAIVLSILVYVTRFYSSGSVPGRNQRQRSDREGVPGNNALFEKELASKAS